MKLRKLVALPALALSAVLVAGCTSGGGTGGPGGGGSTPLTPKEELAKIITESGKSKDSTATMSLDTTAEDLTKLFKAANNDKELTANDQTGLDMVTKIVPKLTMKVSAHSHGAELNAVKDPREADAALQIAVDGKPIDFVWVASQAYLKADVDGIGQATGLFTSTQVKAMANSAAAQMPWITNVIDGQWVALDKDTVLTFLDQAKAQAASASPSATASVDPARAQAMFLDASEVTKDGANYKIVTDAKKFITAAAALNPDDEFTDTDAQEANASLNDGANLDMTVTVADGKVSKVVIDIADIIRTWPKPNADQPQLAKLAAADFKLNGVVETSSANPNIAAPSAAATIPAKDLQQLMPKR